MVINVSKMIVKTSSHLHSQCDCLLEICPEFLVFIPLTRSRTVSCNLLLLNRTMIIEHNDVDLIMCWYGVYPADRLPALVLRSSSTVHVQLLDAGEMCTCSDTPTTAVSLPNWCNSYYHHYFIRINLTLILGTKQFLPLGQLWHLLRRCQCCFPVK